MGGGGPSLPSLPSLPKAPSLPSIDLPTLSQPFAPIQQGISNVSNTWNDLGSQASNGINREASNLGNSLNHIGSTVSNNAVPAAVDLMKQFYIESPRRFYGGIAKELGIGGKHDAPQQYGGYDPNQYYTPGNNMDQAQQNGGYNPNNMDQQQNGYPSYSNQYGLGSQGWQQQQQQPQQQQGFNGGQGQQSSSQGQADSGNANIGSSPWLYGGMANSR